MSPLLVVIYVCVYMLVDLPYRLSRTQPDANTIYYLFSTVAQCLGTSLGIVAACAAARLHTIGERATAAHAQLLKTLGVTPPGPGDHWTAGDARNPKLSEAVWQLKSSLYSADADRIDDAIAAYYAAKGEDRPRIYGGEVAALRGYVRFLSRGLYTAVWVTTPTVAISLFGLAAAPAFVAHPTLALLSIAFVVLSGVLSLVVLASLVCITVEDRWKTVGDMRGV